jgi:methionyl-tRNA formyltransferase
MKFDSVNSDDCVKTIREIISPDIIISVFFNQILKKEVLSCAREAALNIHPSPLPNYKGMAPIMWMIAEAAKVGGTTIHHMNEKIDEGKIISVERFEITQSGNYFGLYEKSAEIGAELLISLLKKDKIPEGTTQSATGIQKKHSAISPEIFAKLIKKGNFLKFKSGK